MAKSEEKLIKEHHKWLKIMDCNDHDHDSYSTTSSSSIDDGSVCSSSTSSDHAVDIQDEASSKNHGPLFELSELMTHLPIKRGLSKHYEGKSQSFTSLAGVKTIEDVAKKARSNIPQRRKITKSSKSKSCGNGLDAHKPYTLPKPIISKKVQRSCLFSLTFSGTRRGHFLTSTRPPPIPLQKKF